MGPHHWQFILYLRWRPTQPASSMVYTGIPTPHDSYDDWTPRGSLDLAKPYLLSTRDHQRCLTSKNSALECQLPVNYLQDNKNPISFSFLSILHALVFALLFEHLTHTNASMDWTDLLCFVGFREVSNCGSLDKLHLHE